jgi:myosin heavy subunit
MNNRLQTILFFSLAVVLGLAAFYFYNSQSTEHRQSVQKEAELTQKLSEKEAELTQKLSEKDAAIAKLTQQKTDLENQWNTKLADMEAALKAQEQNNQALSDEAGRLKKEKEALETENADIQKNISQLNKKIRAFQADKLDLLNAIKKLQNDTEKPPSAGKSSPESSSSFNPAIDSINLGKIVVKASTGVPAHVEQVDKVYGFIVVTAGAQEGLSKNSVINIVRKNEFIAKALVQEARKDVSGAIVLPEWTKKEIKVGDLVSL